ncbi:MAG: glycosyltransferase [candidate division WOR-3 bacterium]
MRILIDGTSITKGGGVSTHITMILKNFSDHENKYFVLIDQKKAKEIVGRDDFEYLRIPFFNRVTKFFYEQFVFPFICLFYKIDLFYLPKQNSTMIKFFKTVSTIHDFIPEKRSSKEDIFTRYYWKIEYNLISKRSDGVIFITKNCMDIYKKRFRNLESKKSSVIYNGFDTYKKYENQKEEYILIPSTLKERKNITLALKLAKDLKEFFRDKKILITGRVDDETLKEAVKEFEFKGYLPFNEFEKIINDTFVIIYLSREEGFSLPVAEGLFLGKRVVCMDIPVHREVYKDLPIYYIMDLSYKENLDRIIEKVKGDKKYEQRFKSWKECSKETEEFFRNFK